MGKFLYTDSEYSFSENKVLVREKLDDLIVDLLISILIRVKFDEIMWENYDNLSI